MNQAMAVNTRILLRTMAVAVVFGAVSDGGLCAEDSRVQPPKFEETVLRAPAVRAAWRKVEAARERAGAAGLFPDPEVEGMAERGSNSDGASWPKWSASIRQPLPRAGERAAAKDKALAELAMAEAEWRMLAGDTAAETAMLVAEARAAREKLALLDSQAGRLEKVVGAVDARIAAGTGRLEDRLALHTWLAEIGLMREAESQMEADARLRIQALLGDAVSGTGIPEPVPSPDAGDWRRSPAARMAEAREQEARAMGAMARAGARPMSALALTASREEMPMETEDMVGIAFMMEIPWRARKSAAAGERAGIAEEDAARWQKTAARDRHAAALARLRRASAYADAARALSQSTLGKLAAESESLLGRAASSGVPTGGMDQGMPDIVRLLEIEERRVAVEMRRIDAEARERAAAAMLWGFHPFSGNGENPPSTTAPTNKKP